MLLAPVVSLIIGISLGWMAKDWTLSSQPQVISHTPKRTKPDFRAGQASLINPLLECDPNTHENPPNMRKLYTAVNEAVKGSLKDQLATEIAVYYKALNTGAWFGVYPDSSFAAASLSKVPLMATIYKLAENNPKILDQKILFNPSLFNIKGADQNLPENESLKPNQSYSVSNLIERMIIKSDNIATIVVADGLKLNLARMFKNFGINYKRKEGTIYLTPKNYAAIFRILYNSTYLNEHYSNKALTLLTQSEFQSGIRETIPWDIVVANKFGVRTQDKEGLFQLHDCGIIYYPDSPYLLCVMTKGKELPKMRQVISGISHLIYGIKEDEQSI